MLTKLLRRGLGDLVRGVRNVRDHFVHATDPTPWLTSRMWNQREGPPAALICVYRSRHAGFVEKLVDQALSLNMKIALWALDNSAQSLAPFTIGSGPGLRLVLFNRLFESLQPIHVEYLVVSDDDVTFTRGNLGQLLSAIKHCGFGLAQPAIAIGWNHKFNRKRILTIARWSSFVEIGPLFVVDKNWLSRMVPFPEDYGMGWGLDITWQELILEGCRFGIVDSVCINHLLAPREYDEKAARKPLKRVMKMREIQSIREVQHTYATWHAWQSEPPWFKSPELSKDQQDLISRPRSVKDG